eukprot:GHUV01037512.1.p2 GENE.GHUV01037512.1~~GHUV01037512.1.p2  ORF type:complete len:115 (-),score=16.23 GHUV01037512.1:638-982(-)
MYTAFLAVARACGTPAMLAALALGQVSNLMGCLTTYGIGSAPPYFGAGYVPQGDWLKVGLTAWMGLRVLQSLNRRLNHITEPLWEHAVSSSVDVCQQHAAKVLYCVLTGGLVSA